MADAVEDDDEVNVEDEVEISVPIPALFSLSTLMLWRRTVRPMSRMKNKMTAIVEGPKRLADTKITP